MAEKPEKSAKEESSASGKGGSNLPIVVAVVFMGVLNVGAIGGLGYFMMTRAPLSGPAAPPAATSADGDGGETAAGASDDHDSGAAPASEGKGGGKSTPGVLHQMPNIVVRLKDVERDHHARISLALEFKETAEKAAVEASLPRVREACIAYASDRRYDEMRGSRGLLDLKKVLNSKAREIFGADFQEIYVTEFVAQ